MRSIKFRGIRKDNGEWITGYLSAPDEIKNWDIFPHSYEVLPESVGQFTGLVDKNSNDIYVDDVVDDNGTMRLVKWSSPNASFYLGHTDGNKSFYKEFIGCGMSQSDGPVRLDNIVVIGSIHTHLELLKQKV